ncbi:MAG: uroporphyrinogen decarboxylase family protein [Candidatus Bathyarchaeia archaeon]
MNSRERCIKAIEFEEVDRVPAVLRARPEVISRLEKHLNVIGFDDVCLKLGVDIRFAPAISLAGGYLPEHAEVKEGPYEAAYTIGYEDEYELRRDRWGILSKWSNKTYTYQYVDYPLRTIELGDYNWPEVDEGSLEHVKNYRKENRGFCVYGGVIHLFEIAWQLKGFNELMVMMTRNALEVEKILDKLNDIRLRQARLLLEADVDVIYDGDDVGAQNTMIISPFLWRKYLKPRYKLLSDLIHSKGKYFFFHSDGWIEPIIQDLVEIGVDILNPIQPETMDPLKIRRLSGGKVAFEGTLSIQRTLPFGTVEDVRELGPTGLILGPSHDIQPDTPLENIIAIYDAIGTLR